MRALVFLSLLLTGCAFADVTAFLKAAPTGYPNWQVIAAVLWLVVTAILKARPTIAANDPLELLANLLVRVPLVGRVVQPWTTPGTVERTAGPPPAFLLLLVPLLLAPGCAAFQQQPVALQKAEMGALKCGIDAVQKEMANIAPPVLDALAGERVDWDAQLTQLEQVGTSALTCAVAHALFDALGGQVASLAELEEAVARKTMLADNGAIVLSTPTRRTMARGLVYLRAHLPPKAPVR